MRYENNCMAEPSIHPFFTSLFIAVLFINDKCPSGPPSESACPWEFQYLKRAIVPNHDTFIDTLKKPGKHGVSFYLERYTLHRHSSVAFGRELILWETATRCFSGSCYVVQKPVLYLFCFEYQNPNLCFKSKGCCHKSFLASN